jgi:hypothetical protein
MAARNVKITLVTATILLHAMAPCMAMADDDDCTVPMAKWEPREAIYQVAKSHGWAVQRIKIDDGCFELKGQDDKGRAIEVKLDPRSLAVIQVEHKSRGHDDDYNDGRRGALSDSAHSGDVASPTSRSSKRTTAPTKRSSDVH